MAKALKRVHEETPWWVRGAVLFTALVLLALMYVVVDYTSEVKTYADQNRLNAIMSCEQGNRARKGDIENLQGDIDRLRATAEAEKADIRGLRRSGVNDIRWIRAHGKNVLEINENIAQKQKAIDTKLASIRPYEIAPGSPIKDCRRANPKE